MQIDLEEIRRHYDGLTDEALLGINPNELTDAARTCWDEEIARRELQPGQTQTETSEPALESESPQSADVVEIGVYADPAEAKLALALLKGADIPAFLASEKARSMIAYPSNFAGSFELMVPTSLADQAREVLASQISEEELAAQAEAATPEEE